MVWWLKKLNQQSQSDATTISITAFGLMTLNSAIIYPEHLYPECRYALIIAFNKMTLHKGLIYDTQHKRHLA
jgi:hypothetical protein